jgi:hypothetical protein
MEPGSVVPIEFKVIIEPSLPALVPEAISFETGATPQEVADPSMFAYEHHASGFSSQAGALVHFFEDLIKGRQFPLTFATHAIRDVDTLFAIALFLHRDLAIHPSTPGVVTSVDMVHRLGDPFLGHLEPGLERLLRRMRVYFPKGLSRGEAADRLSTALGWIHGYITEGTFPHPGVEPPPPRVLDIGTNGFVLAQQDEPRHLYDAWIALYRKGFLRGVVVSGDRKSRRNVLASRKSLLVNFDLQRAASLLNEMEVSIGEPPGWESEGQWLTGPEAGTLILTSHMMEVFLRV